MTPLKPARDAHLIAIAQVWSVVYATVLREKKDQEPEHEAAAAARIAVSEFERFLDRRSL